MLPYGRQSIGEQEIGDVVEVLRSDWITQGPKIAEFEAALAERCGARYAVAVSSGTAALHLACLAAGVTAGDLVVTSALTFVASANCALYCGADVAFVDIDLHTLNLTPPALDALAAAGRRIKAIIPVHFGGRPCAMEEISAIAMRNGWVIIEDASHALGAKWLDRDGGWHPVGSCSHSSMSVFSFHPVKHITTAEGGAITTKDPELYSRLVLLRNHGIVRDSARLEEVHGPWYYEMQALGFNYRMTDVQAALGIGQLRRADEFLARRSQIAERYRAAFADCAALECPLPDGDVRSSWHLYPVRVRQDRLSVDRRTIFEELRAQGIGVQVHYIPVPLQPYYRRRFGFKPGDFPQSEQHYAATLSLPLYPALADEDVEFVIACVKKTLARHRRLNSS